MERESACGFYMYALMSNMWTEHKKGSRYIRTDPLSITRLKTLAR